MKALKAKDFLVQQTAEQAVLENVPLSDLEKRMMYFTETDECPEDPIALNEAFETEYSTEEYEAKISRLLHHAYKRVRRDDSQNSETWDSAMKCLRQGDHYLLVMWDMQLAAERPPYDSVKLFGAAILILFAFIVFNFAWDRIAPHFPHSLAWITRRLIMYSLMGLFFIGRYYWRRNRG